MDFIITYWVEFLFGILITVLTYFIRKLNIYRNTLASTTGGVRVLLKNRIIKGYTTYKEEGQISISEKELIDELYQEYKHLDENSVVDQMVKEMMKTPRVPGEKECSL